MPTYWSCRNTILDSLDRATTESIYADMESRESRISTTEFDFDFEIINTRTYRRALTQSRSKHHRKGSRYSQDTVAPYRVMGNQDEDLIDLRSQLDTQSRASLQRLPKACADLQGLELDTDDLLDGVIGSEGLAHSEKDVPSDFLMDSLQHKPHSLEASLNGDMQQRQKGSPFSLHALVGVSDVSQPDPKYPPEDTTVPLSMFKPRPEAKVERLLEGQHYLETPSSENLRLPKFPWEEGKDPVPISSFKPELEGFGTRLFRKVRGFTILPPYKRPEPPSSAGRQVPAKWEATRLDPSIGVQSQRIPKTLEPRRPGFNERVPRRLEPGVRYSC